jgi:eukaryotic-like serine/threonine-protein kinase
MRSPPGLVPRLTMKPKMNPSRAQSAGSPSRLAVFLLIALTCLVVRGNNLHAQQPKGGQQPGARPKNLPGVSNQGGTGASEEVHSTRSLKKKAPTRSERLWLWVKERWFYLVPAAIGIFAVGTLLVVYQKQNRQRSGRSTAASDVIGGYRLQNLMMTGQTSQVWEVVEVASGRHFAMKLLLPEKLEDEEHRKLLFHEAEVGIQLAHPNIIKIIKLVKEDDNPYFVMEFFPAGNLKLRVMHKKWDFIKEKAHDIFKQAATGLAYMNANGWVHRDVKPDNIMVNSAGEVRLIDFALAQRIGRSLFGRRGKPAGTRSYMSPEQIRGEALDGRADVYSFGASAYEVVAGRPPFRAANPTDLLHKQILEKPISPQVYNADVSDEFAALILRCLAKKKQDRPRDFHEILMALRGMQVFKSEAAKPRAE